VCSGKLPAVISFLTMCVAASNVAAGSITFSSVAVPDSDTAKRRVTASDSARVDGKKVNLGGYKTLLRTGDRPGNSHFPFGQLINIAGKGLRNADGTARISNSPDFSSLIKGKQDHQLYMVTHFEDGIGAMYITHLQKNKHGELAALETRPIDFSSVNGGWKHCAGSVTPWGTHLGSEEYEPDAGDPGIMSSRRFRVLRDYFAGATRVKANPYNYGFAIEVGVNGFDDVTVTKHYAMGRVSMELAYVMPDRKTAYISDDGTDVGLYRFVADKAGDLSAGNLYAAKWIQTSDAGAGAAKIEWKNLGHARDSDIQRFLKTGGTYEDIFEKDVAGCTAIRTSTGKECLKVKKDMEIIASRLETRRYAALKGATTEWRKMEGITYNPDQHVLYLSMSQIGKGMQDRKDGGNNDIRLQPNPCGAVYTLELDGNFAATRMEGLLAGKPRKGDAKNTCDLNGLANPDNISYLSGYNTLIIGEDSGSGHQNDAVWSYGLDRHRLTRILTTPYGAESTSVYFYPDFHSHAYLMAVVQHPFGESDQDQLRDPSESRAYVGYMGPFPVMPASGTKH
jgi:secreted PhoX family phosphatase